jgi:hypothetical protein
MAELLPWLRRRSHVSSSAPGRPVIASDLIGVVPTAGRGERQVVKLAERLQRLFDSLQAAFLRRDSIAE